VQWDTSLGAVATEDCQVQPCVKVYCSGYTVIVCNPLNPVVNPTMSIVTTITRDNIISHDYLLDYIRQIINAMPALKLYDLLYDAVSNLLTWRRIEGLWLAD
jgi:hypothetical protein